MSNPNFKIKFSNKGLKSCCQNENSNQVIESKNNIKFFDSKFLESVESTHFRFKFRIKILKSVVD